MKLLELINYSDKRISITQVGLRLNPGQTTRVHPATVSHPAVSPYMGNGLKEVREEIAETKVEPIAPAAPAKPQKKKAVAPPVEEIPEEVDAPSEEVVDETVGTTLRDAYVEAPGITDANVDAIMGAYPTFEELADASKEDLVDLGVAKSYTKKLLGWASYK
jgi:hypothetical protein